jgi:hypothetical protein
MFGNFSLPIPRLPPIQNKNNRMTTLPSQPTYNFGLNKASTNNEIKAYFKRVLELYQSNEAFPINLDDVWPLVYSEKSKAVRTLKKSFIEGEDYTSFAQNGKREIGGTQTIIYRLSVSCMEYLIAKKVRAVFNVYREVFKKVANGEVGLATAPSVQRTSAEMLLLYAQQMVENERKVKMLESKQQHMEERLESLEERTNTEMHYCTIVGFANRYGIRVPLQVASTLGRVSVNKCKQLGYELGQVQDPRFGWVNTYPEEVLQETFRKYYPNKQF